MNEHLGSIIPARFLAPAKPIKYEQEVIINWLDVEVPCVSNYVQLVNRLRGWRNREVFWFVRSCDWTTGMYD